MEENIKILNMWNEKVKTLGKLKLKEAQELFIEMKKESNIKEWKKISIFHECRSLCDRISVKETWRILCKSNP